MSNVGSNQGGGTGQPGQSGQAGQPAQQRKVVLFRPEQMRVLPEQFSAEEKQKWETGLRALWGTIEKNQPDTQQHQDAKRKLFEFSRTLQAKLHAAQNQRINQINASGQNPAARPASQSQPQQTQGGESSQQNRQKPPINAKLMEHVTNFPYHCPPSYASGSAEGSAWIQNAKNQYLKALMSMEQGASRLATFEQAVKKREEEGKPLTNEEEKDYNERKEQAQKQHSQAKAFVDKFRSEQSQYRSAAQGANPQVNTGQPGTANGNTVGANQVARPQLNPQQQVPNPVTQTVNAAFEAARNQQSRQSISHNNQLPQQGQMPSAPSQIGGQQNIKAEGQGPTPINTQISQIRQGSMQSNNSPLSAVPRSAGPAPQSANPAQVAVPQALSHSDALGLAARTYSSSNTTSAASVMGHSHPSTRETSVITNKMPIPKTLPERATQPPQPVSMPRARPTFNGGADNGGNGVLGQPVMPKPPGYNMDHEGDRVLSKKKLDELVRQVTGGGQGEGQSLQPDVEESILTVADNFVDQVLTAACKNAKERGSKVLEIRDIQLTLERGYNIRIPGYSSDEVRTVRKIQPSPQWISKMSAVQAAKVTGGNKGGD